MILNILKILSAGMSQVTAVTSEMALEAQTNAVQKSIEVEAARPVQEMRLALLTEELQQLVSG